MNKQLKLKLGALLFIGFAIAAHTAISMNKKNTDETKESASNEDDNQTKMMNKIISSRITTLESLKENSKQPYTQIVSQEIEMREKEIESLNRIIENPDKMSSELGSWISSEVSEKDEDRETLENELDIIIRMIQRRQLVTKKIEQQKNRQERNKGESSEKTLNEFSFRNDELKLLRARKRELMKALDLDKDTISERKKESRRKLGRLSKTKKNKKQARRNKRRNNKNEESN